MDLRIYLSRPITSNKVRCEEGEEKGILRQLDWIGFFVLKNLKADRRSIVVCGRIVTAHLRKATCRRADRFVENTKTKRQKDIKGKFSPDRRAKSPRLARSHTQCLIKLLELLLLKLALHKPARDDVPKTVDKSKCIFPFPFALRHTFFWLNFRLKSLWESLTDHIASGNPYLIKT